MGKRKSVNEGGVRDGKSTDSIAPADRPPDPSPDLVFGDQFYGSGSISGSIPRAKSGLFPGQFRVGRVRVNSGSILRANSGIFPGQFRVVSVFGGQFSGSGSIYG